MVECGTKFYTRAEQPDHTVNVRIALEVAESCWDGTLQDYVTHIEQYLRVLRSLVDAETVPHHG